MIVLIASRQAYYGGIWIQFLGGRELARHIRDIPVYGRGMQEVQNEIMAWASVGKAAFEENRGTYFKVQLPVSVWQRGLIASVKRVVEITLSQDPNGILVHLEGYMKDPFSMGKEEAFSDSAIMGALPKRQGYQAMDELSRRLGMLSAVGFQQPQYPVQQMQPMPPAAPVQPWAQSGAVPYPQQNPYVPQPPPQQAYQQQVAPQPPPAIVSPPSPPATPASRFCTSCGSPVVGFGKFCASCGSPIE
jgi:hypothetical protein